LEERAFDALAMRQASVKSTSFNGASSLRRQRVSLVTFDRSMTFRAHGAVALGPRHCGFLRLTVFDS
jgi:hypothetical protein